MSLSMKRTLTLSLVLPGVISVILLVASGIASAVTPLPTISVAVKDTINGDGENIRFSGQASITGKVIDDPVFRGPLVLQLVIDFSKLKGVGVSTGRAYGTVAQTIIHRPLLSFDPIEATFPFYPAGEVSLARTALASFAIRFALPVGLNITSKLSSP